MERQQIGRYRITCEIGRGAMGIVYRALDPVIGRAVAIKTVQLSGFKGNASPEELRERLHREAQTAGVLNHPGIITIHDIGTEGEEAYIVMEYVDGRTLEEVFASGIPQHTNVLLGILRRSAEALDYAHSKGIVHRDIKPSNIMVAKDGAVKIADFGIARFSGSTMTMTQTGFVLGTPNYMSPEQAQARRVDGRSDQFSLAVLAYRFLTGKLPFDAPTLTAILSKLLWEEPEFAATELDPAIRIVLAKALAKDPSERYGSCTEFMDQLEKAYVSCRPEVPGLEDSGAAEPILCPAAAAGDLEPETQAASASGSAQSKAPAAIPAMARSEDETATDLASPEPVTETPLPLSPPLDEERPPAASRRYGVLAAAGALAVATVVVLLAMLIWRRPAPPVSEAPAAASDAAQLAPQSDASKKKLVRQPAAARTPEPAPAAKILPVAPASASAKQATGASPGPTDAVPGARTPRTGIITWSGRMQKNSILVISSEGASFGVASGTFPGIPVKVEIEPATVRIRVPPGAENGWKQLMVFSGSERYSSLIIRWTEIR